jgi:hypothetical protein
MTFPVSRERQRTAEPMDPPGEVEDVEDLAVSASVELLSDPIESLFGGAAILGCGRAKKVGQGEGGAGPRRRPREASLKHVRRPGQSDAVVTAPLAG